MSQLFPSRIVAALAAIGALTHAAGASAMSAYTWKKRPLVVFAPSSSDAALARQKAIVASSRAGMAERHMVVVYVVGDSVSADLGAGPGMGAGALRARYGVSAGAFRAVLVGKDGGSKLSSGSPLSAGTLFATIDAMPMRRDEMRRR
jgi:hypothetical protein